MAVVVLFLIVAVFGGGVVALVVVVAVSGARRARERRDGLAAFAAARGWLFTLDGAGLKDRFTGAPFGQGRSRSVRNVIEGRWRERPFVAFDYSYVTSNGDDTTTHRFSVVAMHLGLVAPSLGVSPQGSLGRFFTNLFGTDLVVGDRAFDDRFHVATDSEEFARDVLRPEMTAWLTAFTDRAWRIAGDQLFMFRAGAHTPPEIDGVLGEMAALLDRVPPHVWDRLRGHP